MPKVLMVHHINVQITDRQRTRKWYEKVLGATFLDRGPALNTRQLQLNIGNAEMHFSDTDHPTIASRVHFAVEVENWDEMLAHLDTLGVAYSRTGRGAFDRVGTGSDEHWGKCEDSGEHLTLSRFMVYCASNTRRYPLWPLYGLLTCRPAPQSAWL